MRQRAPQLVFELFLDSLGQNALLSGKKKFQVQCESKSLYYVNIDTKWESVLFEENLAYKIFSVKTK